MKKLRIFYGFDKNLASSFDMGGKDIWTVNIHDTLVDMGHDLVSFDYDLGEFFKHLEKTIESHQEYAKKHRNEVVAEFLRQIRAAHEKEPIDMLLSYFYDHFMTPEAIEEVKKMGILAVNYNCNASYQLELISEVSPAFDYCLTVEDFRFDDYKALGANAIYFQEGANPKYYKPCDVPKEYEVIFIGQCYGDRPDHIRYLLDQGIDIKCFGPNWDKVMATPMKKLKNLFYKIIGKKKKVKPLLPSSIIGKVLPFDEMIKTYSKAKIAINFGTCGETHLTGQRVTQIRLRDFEAPMCGVFYLTEDNAELKNFYKSDKELIFYNDKEDLSDKIKYYLANDNEREKIAKAGRDRAIKEHSWEKRFEKCFKEIGVA